MTGRGGTSAWLALYTAERNRVLLERVRWCAAVALSGIAFWTLQGLTHPSAGLRLHLVFSAFGAVVGIAGWLGSRLVPTSWAVPLAVSYISALMLAQAVSMQFTPGVIETAAPALMLICIGTSLVLPWGAGAQAIVCLVAVGGYTWGVLTISGAPAGSAYLVATTTPVAIVAAWLSERYTRLSFIHKWQQTQLVALAGKLAGLFDESAIITHALASGRHMLSAVGATFALYHPAQRTFRTQAYDGFNGAPPRWMLGYELPEDSPLAATVLRQGALEVSATDERTPIHSLMEEFHIRRVLFAAARHGAEDTSLLAFSRFDDEPFHAAEHLLARAIVDQATLALRTARLVAHLRRASAAKSEFVSSMSHELRTPINVILGFAEMARDPRVPPSERTHCLIGIDAAARDLLHMIEGTLEIGKIESGRDQLELEPLVLSAFWKRLGDGFARVRRHPGVQFHWAESVPDALLVTDARKLELIIRNLVVNALKFTEAGSVHAGCWLEDGTFVVEVTDTGIGIQPDDHETIFEMFRQADGSNTRRFGGSGLGLFLVRTTVHRLGGAIHLASEPGKGSVFTVRLPPASGSLPNRSAA